MSFFLLLFVSLSYAGEILYEQQWSRIVSGDEATRLTREIAESPRPADINTDAIQRICTTMGLPTQDAAHLQAWRKGVQTHGWAQWENEPEQDSYHVTQILLPQDRPNTILARNYRLQGKTAEATFSLNGEQLSRQKIELPEILDRTVFYNVRTPALFVLNQEHFQKHFFERMIDLDYPGLEAAKKAWKEHKTLLAAHEAAEYFRRKVHPAWPSSAPQKIADQDPAADKVLRHEFSHGDSTIHMGDRIDYTNNPTNNSEWIWGLNRMGHWVTLLHGYRQTAHEAYAREYNLQVIDWVVRNPAPPYTLTRVPNWRNLEAGVRMSGTWPQTFFGFLRSASFQTQAIQLMLASMWSHGEYIRQFPSGLRFVNNWAIIDSNGLAVLGMSFPEFRQASAWASNGLQRLSDQLQKQVYPDGMQHELATGYHMACMHSFYQTLAVATKTAFAVPENFKANLEKMFEYIMYVSTPGRQVPPTNDSERSDVRHWMSIGVDLFNRQDMRFIASNGREGEAPLQTSLLFPWGGQAVMRSGWDEQAMYLFFDGGPTGVSHQHEDKLHVDISAFGRDFLTDGGKGLYIPDKWRDYFVSSRAHNTILVDGLGQNRIDDPLTHRAEQAMARAWISNPVIDFVTACYDNGYGSQRVPVTHSRNVIFKKNEYWLILDVLQGAGKHSIESLYHFTPCEIKVDQKAGSLRTQHADGRNLQLVTTATTPLTIQILQGRENPEQGWIDVHGKREPAPTAVIAGQNTLPVQIATLVEPVRHDQFSAITLQILKSKKGQAHIRVRGPRGEDDWLINLDSENQIQDSGKMVNACLSFKRNQDNTTVAKHSFQMNK